uniref:Uncharacterized protein n=1 Tax=Meloidogyne hapla TaxID=6305 RepID=A0A1I8BVV8_MELHA
MHHPLLSGIASRELIFSIILVLNSKSSSWNDFTENEKRLIKQNIDRTRGIDIFYKSVFYMTFNMVHQPYFTQFEQIDFYELPSFAGGSFKTNGIFDNVYVWFDELCTDGRLNPNRRRLKL